MLACVLLASDCMLELTEVASAGQRSKDREAQEKDRERYRSKSKPKEIVAPKVVKSKAIGKKVMHPVK